MKLTITTALFIAGFAIMLALSIRSGNENELTWQNYVADHHCHIKSQSFWAETVWACDGFEVHHQ